MKKERSKEGKKEGGRERGRRYREEEMENTSIKNGIRERGWREDV